MVDSKENGKQIRQHFDIPVCTRFLMWRLLQLYILIITLVSGKEGASTGQRIRNGFSLTKKRLNAVTSPRLWWSEVKVILFTEAV